MQPAKASDSLPVFPDNRRRHQPIRLDPVRWQIEPRQSQTFICSEAFSLYLEGWRFAMLLDLLTHIYIHKHRITLTNSEITQPTYWCSGDKLHLRRAGQTHSCLLISEIISYVGHQSFQPAIFNSSGQSPTQNTCRWNYDCIRKLKKCCLQRHSKVGRHRGTSESKVSFTSCLMRYLHLIDFWRQHRWILCCLWYPTILCVPLHDGWAKK